MKEFCLILFLLLALTRCTGKSDLHLDDASPFVVSDIVEKESLNLSEIAKEVSVIKLDTGCMLGRIDRILVRENFIYVFDHDFAGSICAFDFSGKLMKRLSLKQDHQFDLDGITDIFYDEQIIVNHGATGKVFFMDDDLEVLKMDRLSVQGNIIYPFNGAWLIFNNGLQKELGYDVLVYDAGGHFILKKYIEANSNDFSFHYDAKNAFNMLDSVVYFSKAFNDTIYTIDSDFGISPEYVINFGNKVPKGYLSSGVNAMEVYTDIQNGRLSFLNGNIHFGSGNSIIVNYLSQGRNKNLLIPPASKISYSSNYFKDDVLSGALFTEIICSDDKSVIFATSSEDLSDMKNINPEFSEKYNISPNDNFLLFICSKF